MACPAIGLDCSPNLFLLIGLSRNSEIIIAALTLIAGSLNLGLYLLVPH